MGRKEKKRRKEEGLPNNIGSIQHTNNSNFALFSPLLSNFRTFHIFAPIQAFVSSYHLHIVEALRSECPFHHTTAISYH